MSMSAERTASAIQTMTVTDQPTRSATAPKAYMDIALPTYISELNMPDTVEALPNFANSAGIMTEKMWQNASIKSEMRQRHTTPSASGKRFAARSRAVGIPVKSIMIIHKSKNGITT